MIAQTTKKSDTDQFLKDLKTAYDECWSAKLATYDVAKKHAPLCIKIITDVLGDVPHLANQRIERRKEDIDGLGALFPDFWSHPDMVIALYQHVAREFDLQEEEDGETPTATTTERE